MILAISLKSLACASYKSIYHTITTTMAPKCFIHIIELYIFKCIAVYKLKKNENTLFIGIDINEFKQIIVLGK